MFDKYTPFYKIDKGFKFSFEAKTCKIITEFDEIVLPTNVKINANQNIITGIQIKNSMLFVPKKYKRELSKDLYYIRKFGIVSHVSKKRIKDPNYIYSLLGKVNFVLSIESNNSEYLEYKRELENILT